MVIDAFENEHHVEAIQATCQVSDVMFSKQHKKVTDSLLGNFILPMLKKTYTNFKNSISIFLLAGNHAYRRREKHK